MNSLHPSVQEGIRVCYEEACADSSIKGVVITGGATPFFMAGADLENVAAMQAQKGLTKAEVAKGIKAGNEVRKLFSFTRINLYLLLLIIICSK